MATARSGLGSRLGLLGASLVLVLAASEFGLRGSGYSLRLGPERVEFGWPDPVVMDKEYLSDPDLLWVPSAYPEMMERLLADPGPDIVFMGDSCTEFGEYQWKLLGRLHAAFSGDLRGESFGVGGWSSYQGLQQLRRDLVRIRPRVAFVYFGWNDHWTGFGVEDKDLGAPAESGLGSLRLVHLVKRARLGWLASKQSRRPLRVAPEDFRRNLVEIVQVSRAAGIVPVLITAPTAHVLGEEPERLAERHIEDVRNVIPLHQRYVSIVREVAAAEDALLCDAARHFEAPSRAERAAHFFIDDGIHLRVGGDDELAAMLFECVRSDPELLAVFEGAGG